MVNYSPLQIIILRVILNRNKSRISHAGNLYVLVYIAKISHM